MLPATPPRHPSATASISTLGKRCARRRWDGAALTLLAPVLLFAGCAPQSPTAVAVVNATPLSPDTFAAYVKERAHAAPETLDAGSRERELKDFEALAAAALEEAATKDGKSQALAELARIEALARAGAERAGVYIPPTEDDLKSAYAHYAAIAPAREYHVAQVLVATESDAHAVIEALNRGGRFSVLAAARSADDSKSRGGDLGWLDPGHLPREFMQAVEALKPGEFTHVPVHSPYGWHVIEVMEAREIAPAEFNSVKAQLATNLIQERYQAYLVTALRTAKASKVTKSP
jgi:peptidyl-prolyl cis-trans isomerase C